MKTYIIHFNKLKERKKKLKKRLKKIKLLDIEWFIQKGYYSKETIEKYYKYNKKLWKEKAKIANRIIIYYPLSKSQIHLAINNFKIREKISKGKEKYALILEDDAIFAKDFEEKLKESFKIIKKKGLKWDIIYLDYLSKDFPKTKKLTILEKRGKYDCYGAGAYIIKRNAAAQTLTLGKITLPNDEELKYRINKLNLKPLWIIPPLVKQESVYGNTEKSGQNQRDKQGIKRYIFWRKKVYSILPKNIQKFFYNQENKIKKRILKIK